MRNKDYEFVVGSGPNGFTAAVTLQKAGFSVLLMEGRDTISIFNQKWSVKVTDKPSLCC